MTRDGSSRVLGAVAATLIWLLADTACAYRPFSGTDADVADVGEFELELGPLQFLHEAARNYLEAPATVLNLGILPRTELVVDFVGVIPLQPLPGESSYSLRDTDLLLKLLCVRGSVQDAGAGPSVALEAGALTPEIHDESGFGASANLIVSQRWQRFVVHVNSELELSRGELVPIWTETVIGELHVHEKFWPVAELLWSRELSTGASEYSALAGAIWGVREGLSLDAAALIASVHGAWAIEARLGFTWAFQLWEQPS
ncbi:MAG TPA: hypothetical protein VJR89_13515 [Polyangiales bacterium]|nr:hypothetical protein [Polyangiales bacterium]